MDQVQQPNPSVEMPLSKSNSWKKIIFVGLIIVVLIIITIIGVYLFVRSQNKNAPEVVPQSNFNSNTPVSSFTGDIEKISGNNLTVSTIVHTSSESITNSTNPQEKKVTYIITVTPQTKIILEPPYIPVGPLETTPSAFQTEGSISDLVVGKRISATSGDDLNKLLSDNFKAITINIMPGATTFSGAIKNITKDSLTVTASPPSVAEVKDYTVAVDKNTKVVNPQGNPIALSALSNGTEVEVYSNSDVNLTKNPKALKIIIKIL